MLYTIRCYVCTTFTSLALDICEWELTGETCLIICTGDEQVGRTEGPVTPDADQTSRVHAGHGVQTPECRAQTEERSTAEPA